jgi:tetratricopeptide (TPR) repeat protein
LPARTQLSQLLIASGAAQSALDLLNNNALPPAQKNMLGVVIQRNWALLALKQLAEARAQVDRGLAAVRSPELLIQDAYLKLEQKNYSSARASLAEALNKSPEDLRILRLIVASYAAEKQPAAAITAVRDYAQQHPKSAVAQQFLADVLMANGQPQQARTALLAAKAANPKFTQADLSLARLDATEGHTGEASKTLSAILSQNPNNVPARLMLASIKETGGNPNAAIDDYKKILQLQPANVLALNNLAYDLVEYGNQPDEALKYAQRAAELAPEAPAVENTLGWVLYRKGMYSLAVPHLEKAADKEPSARRKIHLALAYLKMGDQERGQRNLDAAVKLDPNIPEIKTARQLLDEMQGGR